MIDTEASLTLLPTSFKALRTRARIHLHLENFDPAVADFKSSIEQAEFEGADADVRSLRVELKKAEAALKRSKTKDYYNILGMCLISSWEQAMSYVDVQVFQETVRRETSKRHTAGKV